MELPCIASMLGLADRSQKLHGFRPSFGSPLFIRTIAGTDLFVGFEAGYDAMHFLTWFDNRTLIVCLCVLTSVFTALLLGLRSFYPGIAGVLPITGGLVLGTISMLMLVTEGRTPLWFSIVGGGAVLFAANFFVYRGALEFVRSDMLPFRFGSSGEAVRRLATTRDRSTLLYAVCIPALGTLIFCTQIRFNPAPCLIALTLPMAASRGLIAWTLFRAAAGRRHIQWIAGTTAVFALVALCRVATLFLWKTPMDVMHEDHTQTLALVLTLLLVAVQGVLFTMLFAGNVAATIERQADLDHVSGMLNRRGLESALNGELARARRGGIFAVLLIDLDHFKEVNDRFGHSAGDQALRLTAKCLSQVVRVYDVLGRYGGDEFLVLLPQATSEQAMVTAERIRKAFNEQARLPNASVLSLSIGATCFLPGDDKIQLVGRADAALYQAKRDGRDCARLNLMRPEPIPTGQVPFPLGEALPGEA